MATIYTPNAHLAKPAVGDRGWGPPLQADLDALDGMAALGGLCVTPLETPVSTTLNVAIAAGAYRAIAGTFASFAGASPVAVPASTSRMVWLTDGGVATLGTAWPSSATPHVRLAIVTTDGTKVTSIVDQRVVCSSLGPIAGGGGGSAAILIGTASGRPAAGTAQRLYLPTDGNSAWEDDGAVWRPFGPVFPLADPPLTGWTQVNFGGSTTTSNQPGQVTIREGNAPGGIAIRALTRAAPATPYTITAAFLFNFSIAHTEAGLLFRETSSGKLQTLCYRNDNQSIHGYRWDTPAGALNGDDLNPGAAMDLVSMRFLRISDDGTNLKYYTSADGLDFELAGSVARTGYMSTGPNEVGFFLNVQVAGFTGQVKLISWA